MKHTAMFISLALGLFSSVSAHAAFVELVQIHADYFPGNAYSIGLDLSDKLQISEIYFDQDGQKTLFPLSDLGDFQPIMQVSGSTVVQMRIVSQTGNHTAVVELLYTKNVLTGSQDSMQVSIDLNEATGQYGVTDLRYQTQIHSAAVHTHYTFPHIATGISSIETE